MNFPFEPFRYQPIGNENKNYSILIIDLHNLSTVATGMFTVLLLSTDLARGALVQPGLPHGLHGPLQGLPLVDDGHLNGSQEAGIVLYTLEIIIFKTEIKILS